MTTILYILDVGDLKAVLNFNYLEIRTGGLYVCAANI